MSSAKSIKATVAKQGFLQLLAISRFLSALPKYLRISVEELRPLISAISEYIFFAVVIHNGKVQTSAPRKEIISAQKACIAYTAVMAQYFLGCRLTRKNPAVIHAHKGNILYCSPDGVFIVM